jgi:DNA-binding SARP family transcriptional activator
VDFRVLGPLEVRRDGRPLPLGGRKQRLLLALLLLRSNQVVPTARLVDDLWAGSPPETAQTALQGYVSQLRKALEPEGPPYRILVTQAPGYTVSLASGNCDLDRFETLVRGAREEEPRAAAEKLRAALALWRGEPLADLAGEPCLQAHALRLEELRLGALEARIEADLALGRHDELIPELEALVGEQPLRERPRAHLMVALYRSGRQADALEVYRTARGALADELGLEPSPLLQELERRILRHDPALVLPSLATAGRKAAGAFLGREDELALLLAGLDDAIAGRGRLFLVGGAEGAGKTRLADEVASRAKQRGAMVLWGRTWEAGGAPPYWPWVQALRAHVSGGRERTRLPELVGASGDRFTLFEATTAFLSQLAARQPLVVVLDDLHAADTDSLMLLEFVAAELAVLPILVLALYRDETEPLARVARFASARLHL